MVDNLAPLTPDVPAATETTASAPSRQRPRWAFRGRFVAAFAALALVIAGSGVLTWVLLGKNRPEAFSPFTPTAKDPVDRAQQIADYLEKRYLNDDGTPLVAIQAGETDNPLLPGAPTLISVVTSPPAELFAFEPGDILFYKLCPSGTTACSLDAGADRATLGPIYARESLELALYGLKYVTEAESVVVILPTGFVPAEKSGDSPPRIAHYYRKRDLANKLDRPLAKTLPGRPPTPGNISPAAVAQIEALTKGTKYRLQTTTSEDKTFNIIVATAAP